MEKEVHTGASKRWWQDSLTALVDLPIETGLGARGDRMTESVATKIQMPGTELAGGIEAFVEDASAGEGRETFERQMAAVEAAESVSIQDLVRIRIR